MPKEIEFNTNNAQNLSRSYQLECYNNLGLTLFAGFVSCLNLYLSSTLQNSTDAPGYVNSVIDFVSDFFGIGSLGLATRSTYQAIEAYCHSQQIDKDIATAEQQVKQQIDNYGSLNSNDTTPNSFSEGRIQVFQLHQNDKDIYMFFHRGFEPEGDNAGELSRPAFS